jgi:hypothetical protein
MTKAPYLGMAKRPRVLCRFCDQRGPRSREHVWPDWIGNRLPERGWTTIVGWSGIETFTEKRIAFTSRLPDVCETCNGGWMRDIEEAVREILAPMMFGAEPTTISPDQQSAIADWVYVRALILQAAADAAGRTHRLDVPAHWYHELAREHGVRAGSHTWIGALTLPNADLRTALHRSATLAFVPPTPADPWLDGYYATFNVGYLIVRILVLARGMPNNGLATTRGFGPSVLIPIWPVDVRPVHWPPRFLSIEEYGRLLGTPPVVGAIVST